MKTQKQVVEDMHTAAQLVDKLQYAKNAVRWLLDNETGNVDFHGLSYWASEVERLREEIKKLL